MLDGAGRPPALRCMWHRPSHPRGSPASGPIYTTWVSTASTLLSQLPSEPPVPLEWADGSPMPALNACRPRFCPPQRPKLIMMSASPSWMRENCRGVTLLQTWKARKKASSTVSESRSGV